jgi:aminoglycoside phosphotransferase (APT) family kinase protein
MEILDDVARLLGGARVGHEPLVGGVSARVTAVDLVMPDGGPRRVVVREPGAAAWKGSGQETARREFELLHHLHRAGLPVPRPLLVEEQRAKPFFVMEFVEGTRDLPAQGPERMADVLARVHALALESTPALPEREDPIASLPEFLGADRAELRARVAERAIALTPRRTLLHGDFWPGNVLWRNGEVVALLDWEDAAVGDPLSDVACCRLELRYVAGASGADAFTQAYGQRTQRALEELPVWDAYVAAAALASMGQWGLPAERVAHMRREAEASLTEACTAMMAPRPRSA